MRAFRATTHKEFAGYIGSCLDVTELLRQQKALNQFEKRVALATEAAHLGIWELDTATKTIWVSDKMRDLFQFPPEGEISYTDFEKRVHPDDREVRDQTMQRAILTQGG